MTPLVGDNVILRSDKPADELTGSENEGGIMIESVKERKNALIRPPMANLDCIFVSMAAAAPAPILATVDKLIAIAEHNSIEPYIVIGKSELDPKLAEEIKHIYTLAGFKVFLLSCETGEGVEDISRFIRENLAGKTAAFSGASGVGKSTLMNLLFPSFNLETGAISRKIERGRHTTRSVDLYEAELDGGSMYIADTPGFSMLDFKQFDFFDKDALPYTFREFNDYIGECRYTKCTHTKEDGCAILEAIREGKIAKSRHDSFLELYEVLKNKKEWDK
jgi:ribosome biogenesis GTPase